MTASKVLTTSPLLDAFGSSLTPYRPSAGALATIQSRSINWGKLFGLRKKKPKQQSQFGPEVDSATGRQQLQKRADALALPQDSIFADGLEEKRGRGVQAALAQKRTPQTTGMGGSLVREHLVRAIDPDPRSRVRWERKMVIRRVHRNLSMYGRETRAERITRTERRHLSKSTALPTSVKKLVHLARQVAGKTVEDALVQMRFSKKKMAREVRWQLEEARDTAVVQHGMGLGRHTGEVLPEGEAVKIQTKRGKHLTIQDPTRLYVEQAWVGRGPLRHQRPLYAAKGRIFMMKSPSTCRINLSLHLYALFANPRPADLSLILKEEKTRIREHKERVTKQARRAPWVHHPNRPVTAQRPYYSW